MNPPRILLANHDRLFLDSLSRSLRSHRDLPFDVAVSSESPEAMTDLVGPCDALVCAVEKPEELESVQRLKRKNAELLVIVLVPPSQKTLADEARRSGADNVLDKHANPESTADLLQTALTLLFHSRTTHRMAAAAKQKSRELHGGIGEKRRILELSRSIAERPPVHQYPVLVVEDEEDAALLLKQALEHAGFSSLHLSNSFDQVVARLSGDGSFGDREKFPLPFLVFLNLDLSGNSGFDVLQWLRSRPDLRNIIVVVHSASGNPQDIRRAYDLGANSFVTKPSTVEELQQLVHAVRQYWVRLNV
jgi:CheY-like chemotaxis protein